MKKGAIFDMDGLLFDTERLFQDSWVKMAKQFGQVPPAGLPSGGSRYQRSWNAGNFDLLSSAGREIGCRQQRAGNDFG
ncbi:MAG: HAD family phosphatase [Lawsonibacter sp.]|nr:HAD family phosphatase [Lawsonibacter sp.]